MALGAFGASDFPSPGAEKEKAKDCRASGVWRVLKRFPIWGLECRL